MAEMNSNFQSNRVYGTPPFSDVVIIVETSMSLLLHFDRIKASVLNNILRFINGCMPNEKDSLLRLECHLWSIVGFSATNSLADNPISVYPITSNVLSALGHLEQLKFTSSLSDSSQHIDDSLSAANELFVEMTNRRDSCIQVSKYCIIICHNDVGINSNTTAISNSISALKTRNVNISIISSSHLINLPKLCQNYGSLETPIEAVNYATHKLFIQLQGINLSSGSKQPTEVHVPPQQPPVVTMPENTIVHSNPPYNPNVPPYIEQPPSSPNQPPIQYQPQPQITKQPYVQHPQSVHQPVTYAPPQSHIPQPLVTQPQGNPQVTSQYHVAADNNRRFTTTAPGQKQRNKVDLRNTNIVQQRAFLDAVQSGVPNHNAIWSGRLSWPDKQTPPGTNARTRILEMEVMRQHPDTLLDTSNWPKEMTLQLMPLDIVKQLSSHLQHNARIVFRFVGSPTHALELYNQIGCNEYAGCVSLQAPHSIRVILLFYATSQKYFLGVIPSDQKNFTTQLKNCVRLKQKNHNFQHITQHMAVPQQQPVGTDNQPLKKIQSLVSQSGPEQNTSGNMANQMGTNYGNNTNVSIPHNPNSSQIMIQAQPNYTVGMVQQQPQNPPQQRTMNMPQTNPQLRNLLINQTSTGNMSTLQNVHLQQGMQMTNQMWQPNSQNQPQIMQVQSGNQQTMMQQQQSGSGMMMSSMQQQQQQPIILQQQDHNVQMMSQNQNIILGQSGMMQSRHSIGQNETMMDNIL